MARTFEPTVIDKLGKLLRLLGSNRDGEILGTVAALQRTLQGAGADWHDLAENIGKVNGAKFTEEDAKEIYAAGVQDGRSAAEAERGVGFHNVDDEGPPWHAIAQECAQHLDQLRDERERQFVQDMVRRTVHRGRLSEKQAKWLRDIYTRVRR